MSRPGNDGATIMFLSLLKFWKENLGWEVALFCEGDTPPVVEEYGIPVVHEWGEEPYSIAIINGLPSIHLIDAVHDVLPVVIWVHEGEVSLWTCEFSPMSLRKAFGKAKSIVFQSEWQVNEIWNIFCKDIPKRYRFVVPNGVPPIASLPQLNRSHGKRVLYVGGVEHRKAPYDLISAVDILDMNVEVVIAGDTEGVKFFDEAQKALLDRPFVRLLGACSRETVHEWMVSSDVFCLPSIDESQSISPLEAALLGLPICMTDLPAHRGIWEHGINCLMSPIHDVRLLSVNIATLLSDGEIAAKLVKNAKKTAEQYAFERFVTRFNDVIVASLA